jgi:hypothetical protein
VVASADRRLSRERAKSCASESWSRNSGNRWLCADSWQPATVLQLKSEVDHALLRLWSSRWVAAAVGAVVEAVEGGEATEFRHESSVAAAHGAPMLFRTVFPRFPAV